MKHEFRVDEADAGRRLDRWLQSAVPELGFIAIRRLLRQRSVRRNGARARGDETLCAGDVVVLHAPALHPIGTSRDPEEPKARPGYSGPDLEVLEEDEQFVFVSKPPGVACSDDGEDTLAIGRWLRERFREEIDSGRLRPEPCHRLDRGTSGLLAIAKTARAHEQFRRASVDGRIRKVYEVVVWGSPPQPTWTCRTALVRRERSGRNEPRVIAAEEGSGRAAAAHTEFTALLTASGRTLLRAELRSGRTHQIRAHCRIEGLHVVHDPRYGRRGDRSGDGPMLHAQALELEIEARRYRLEAPWPEPRRTWLREWGLVLG